MSTWADAVWSQAVEWLKTAPPDEIRRVLINGYEQAQRYPGKDLVTEDNAALKLLREEPKK